MDAVKNWFVGFEKGITRLTQEQRSTFFSECGKHCVQSCVFGMYKQVYTEVQANLDLFFERLNEFPGVRSEIVEPGKDYNLYFEQCVCQLHEMGYVNTPLLCECSRQSVLYTMRTLWEGKQFEVVLCGSILGGAKECKLNIRVV